MDEVMGEEEFEQDLDLHQQDSNPLFVAIIENDFSRLKSLIQSGHSVNSRSINGETMLLHIIKLNRIEMFDYILTLEELQIDQIVDGSSALLSKYALRNEYFAFQLIEKGANIHLKNKGEFTILHLLAMFMGDGVVGDKLKLAQLVIEKGLDINGQESSVGATPLYVACEMGNFDLICMLLYYGALATIPTDNGTLPLAVVPSAPEFPISEEDHAHLLDTLFNLTFESDPIILTLPNLIAAMQNDSHLFPKLVEIIAHVDYDFCDLTELYIFLKHLKTKHFKLFANKFSNILQDLVEIFSILTNRIDSGLDWRTAETKELILTFLESDCVDEFVQNCRPSYPKIGKLIEMWNNDIPIPHMCVKEEVTKIACLMLSHGLTVNSKDLDMVYSHYGYCELFKILLHMEIEMVIGREKGLSMAEFYYEPNTRIETFFKERSLSLDLLSYYNHPKLKELCLSDTVDEEIATKAKSLPTVPSLLQLSRDMARKCIIQRYKIQNSMQFYTTLKWLPINEIYKKIVSLEKKLY